MALFKVRRRRVISARDCWQPDGSPVDLAFGYQMDDEGCAGEDAYGVKFTLEGAPGVTISAWFYAIFAAPDAPGGFQVGWHCVYGSRRESWSHVAYGTDDPAFYGDLEAADDAARFAAFTLVTGRGPSPARPAPPRSAGPSCAYAHARTRGRPHARVIVAYPTPL